MVFRYLFGCISTLLRDDGLMDKRLQQGPSLTPGSRIL